MAIAALTLAIIGLFVWIIPFIGIPVSLIGLILGVIAILAKMGRKRMAISAIIICAIGLTLNVIIIAVGITAIGILGAFYEMFPELFEFYY